MMNPLSFPFWAAGLCWLLFGREAKSHRALGFAFSITIGCFMALHGKDYYSAPSYTLLLAAGGVATERLLEGRWFSVRTTPRRALAAVCFAWLLIGIALILPLVLPVLPLDGFVKYQARLGVRGANTEKSFEGAALPQYFADELPWPEMVAAVSRVYHSLTPEEQAKTAIFGDSYGEAAAVDFFGSQYGLPNAISGHQNYFLWGPRNYTGEVVILIGQCEEDVRSEFASMEVAATLHNPYAPMVRKPAHPALPRSEGKSAGAVAQSDVLAV